MAFKKNSFITIIRTSEGNILFYPWAINKYLLGVFGLSLFSWRGLLVGLIIGFILDCRFVPKARKEKEVNLQLNYLMLGIYALQRSTAFSVIPVSEIIRRFNHFLGPAFIAPRIRLMEDLSRQRIQVEAVCRQIETHAQPSMKDWLLMQLSQLLDHPSIPLINRQVVIKQIADRLGRGIPIPDTDEQASPINRSKTNPVSRQTYLYTKLECNPGDTYETVKKAYYRLAKKHHPDRNHHSPLSVVKFRELKESYEELKQMKGWK
jgi:hypothetical protein